MQKRDLIQANASLENLRQNLDMKDIAKEILLEENYNKFIRSYKFQFVRISVYVLESCGPGMPGPYGAAAHKRHPLRTYSPTKEGPSMSCFKKVLLLLSIVGGINWGIYGIWGFNAVGWLLGGSMSWLSRTVFIIVGLSSLCLIPGLFMAETKTAE
jgi:uncharacterized membrane protein YuzA (DUF378 family)